MNVPNVSIIDYVEALGHRTKRTGTLVRAVCPLTAHSGKGHYNMRLWEDSNGYACHCDGNPTGNIWDLAARINGSPFYGEVGFYDTVAHVCEVLGIEPPEEEAPDRGSVARQVMRHLASVLEPLRMETENAHYRRTEEGPRYRGVDPVTWLSHGVGVLSRAALDTLLDSFDDDALAAAGIHPWNRIGFEWLTHGVVTLYRSRTGLPIAFKVRVYPEMSPFADPTTVHLKPRGDSLIWDPTSYVFGLHTARRTDAPRVLVFEGEADVLAAQVRGWGSAVGMGKGLPSPEQMKQVFDLGREVVFVLDGDAPGQAYAARVAKTYPDVGFIVLDDDTDPDVEIQRYGVTQLARHPTMSARQVRMWAEDFDGELWAFPTATAQAYMQEITADPRATDWADVATVAQFSGLPEEHLTSWLFTERAATWAREFAQNVQAGRPAPF